MNLPARVKAILVSPRTEWEVIAAEQTDVASIYRNYVVILAAIPAVCSLVGLVIAGFPIFGAVRVSIATYVSALVSPLVAAIVIEKLAPKFRSRGGLAQALKMVAYSSTPIWVVGVVNLIPALLSVGIVAALYGIYLFYVGLPAVMKTPIEHVVPFMAVAALTTIVAGIVLRWISASLGVPSYGF